MRKHSILKEHKGENVMKQSKTTGYKELDKALSGEGNTSHLIICGKPNTSVIEKRK